MGRKSITYEISLVVFYGRKGPRLYTSRFLGALSIEWAARRVTDDANPHAVLPHCFDNLFPSAPDPLKPYGCSFVTSIHHDYSKVFPEMVGACCLPAFTVLFVKEYI